MSVKDVILRESRGVDVVLLFPQLSEENSLGVTEECSFLVS